MMGNASSPLGAQRGRCCPLLGFGDHRALPQRHAESCRWAGLGALTVDDSLRSQQAASDRVRAAGVDGLPPQGAAAALEQHCDRGLAMPHSVPAMGGRSFGRRSGLAPSMEGYHPPEHFDPLWKLFYMWEHPSHFPLATWTALTDWGDRLWPELIGILGWQDILLRPWIYVVLTVFLMLVPLQKLQLHGASRARVAVMTGFGVLGYVAVVYLIFFLTAPRRGPCPGRSGTLFCYRPPGGCDIRCRGDQPRSARGDARGDCDCWLNDCGNRDR